MDDYSIDQDSTDQNGDSDDALGFDVGDGTDGSQTGDDGDQPDDGADNQDGGFDDQGTDQSCDDSNYCAFAGGDEGASDALDAIDGYQGPTRIPMKDAEHEAQTVQKVLQPFADGIAGTVNLVGGLEGHALAGVYSLLGDEETAQHLHGVASRAIDDAAAAGRNVLRDIGSPHVDGERESMWNP